MHESTQLSLGIPLNTRKHILRTLRQQVFSDGFTQGVRVGRRPRGAGANHARPIQPGHEPPQMQLRSIHLAEGRDGNLTPSSQRA